MTWFVEREVDQGWITTRIEGLNSYTNAIVKFEELLEELNRAEMRGEEIEFFAVRMEYRR